MLVSYFSYPSTLKIEAICSFETSLDFHRTTRHCIPEDRTLHSHRCDNLRSNDVIEKSDRMVQLCYIRVVFFPGSTRNPRKRGRIQHRFKKTNDWIINKVAEYGVSICVRNTGSKLYGVMSGMTTLWTIFLVCPNCYRHEAIFQQVLGCTRTAKDFLSKLSSAWRQYVSVPIGSRARDTTDKVSCANWVLCLHTDEIFTYHRHTHIHTRTHTLH
jgi:hypothetical protein